MTPRSLFNVILKIFGLLFLKNIVIILGLLTASFSFFTQPGSFDPKVAYGNGILGTIFNLLALIAYCFIIYLLLLRTNYIIDKLKLDQGFNQEEFSFHFSTHLVLTIAIILIGGLILINSIPDFFEDVFSYFLRKYYGSETGFPYNTYIVLSAIKTILGFLIIGERKRIIGFIENKRTKKTDY
jgi:hypothetical protein